MKLAILSRNSKLYSTRRLVEAARELNAPFLHGVAKALDDNFNIQHPTLQVERGDNSPPCRFAPECPI